MGLTGAALFTLVMSAPASAQVYLDAGPGGVAVGVGDPDYNWRYRQRNYWRDDYASDCRVIRERIVTPSGRVIIRTRQICD
jgi:hypothetical protein